MATDLCGFAKPRWVRRHAGLWYFLTRKYRKTMSTKSIYIHFPFCRSKCVYCNFVSFAGRDCEIERYVNAVSRELELWGRLHDGAPVETVYIGGGTPSLMKPKQLSALMSAVRGNFPLAEDCEITMELNPQSGNSALIKAMKKCGINRVSVGLQVADDAILRELNRPHNTADFVATVGRLKRAGITNISADIMLGLPHQNIAVVKHTVELLRKLDIPHVSAYGLKVEKGTPLYKLVRNGITFLPEEDEAVDMYDLVYKTLERDKIYRYEVSNFAKVGYESRHNINYWKQGRYYGIGLNASGFVGDVRYSNLRDMDRYFQRIEEENVRPVSRRHKLTLKEAEFEYIMLALRMDRGMDIREFNELYYTDFIKRYRKTLDRLEKIGVITYDSRTVAVRPEKMYLLNSVLVEFMEDEDDLA